MASSQQQSPRAVVVAVDGSKPSQWAIDWLMLNLFHRGTDQMHLLYVLPATAPVLPPTPVLTSAIMVAATQQWESGKEHDRQEALEMLRTYVHTMCDLYRVPKEHIHTHLLQPSGGASGVAESIVQYVTAHPPHMLVLGCRGMGAIQRACMSFIGLGSVSDYCIHKSTTPTLVARFDKGKEPASPDPTSNRLLVNTGPKKVFVCLDGSTASHRALQWVMKNVLQPHNELHLLAVCPGAVYRMLDDVSGIASAQHHQQIDEECQVAAESVKDIIASATECAKIGGVKENNIHGHIVNASGSGSSDIGCSISKHASEQAADLIVMGCRGLGTVSRSVMGLMGLGSVSDYVVHHGSCPVIVVKSPAPTHDNASHAVVDASLLHAEGGEHPADSAL